MVERYIEYKIEDQSHSIRVVSDDPSLDPGEVSEFIESTLQNFNISLRRIERGPSHFKAHRKRRSQTELRQIREEWKSEEGSIKEAIAALKGERKASLKIFAKPGEDKSHILGFRIIYNSNHS